MEIIRASERPSSEGQTFTGKVTLERVLSGGSDGVTVSVVHFKDGARTNLHVHPGEQILYVLEGEGRVGTESEQHLIYPGDVVREGPGVTHWHGAAPGKNMTHISITTVGSPQWFGPPEE
jgi:quercetin dioxygenase-like cupin family protein